MSTFERPSFTVESIVPLPSPDPKHPNDNRYYEVTTTTPLWESVDEDKFKYEPGAIPLERVLLDAARLRLESEGDSTSALTFCYTGDEESRYTLDPDFLNEALAVDKPPTVRIKEHPELPGLMYIHRSKQLEHTALSMVNDLDTIYSLTPYIPPNLRPAVYPTGTLFLALAKPEADLAQARDDLQDILTI